MKPAWLTVDLPNPRFDLIRVTAVEHLHDHVLWLAFSDGTSGAVDLSHKLVGPALSALRDPREFARVRLGVDTIEWPNGADWSPESLHEQVLATNGSRAERGGGVDAAAAPHPAAISEISRFYGIVITMFYSDHVRPHFHARTGGESIAIEIDGDGLSGSFPASRLPLVFEWRDRHRDELRENWRRMQAGEPALPIAPLA